MQISQSPNNVGDAVLQSLSQIFPYPVALTLTVLIVFVVPGLIILLVKAFFTKLFKKPNKIISLKVLSRVEIPRYNGVLATKLENKTLEEPGIVNLKLYSSKGSIRLHSDASDDQETKFKDKIVISFGEATVEKVIIIDKTKDLNDLDAQVNGRFATFSPKFLNEGDYVKFQVILSNYNKLRDKIVFEGRFREGKKVFQEFDFFIFRDSWGHAFSVTSLYIVPILVLFSFVALQIENLQRNVFWVQLICSFLLSLTVVLTHFSIAREPAIIREEVEKIDSTKLAWHRKAVVWLKIRINEFRSDKFYLKTFVIGLGFYLGPYFLNLVYLILHPFWAPLSELLLRRKQ